MSVGRKEGLAMEMLKKHAFLVTGIACIILACVFFCLSFYQTHNDDYRALQGRQQLDTAIANTYYSQGKQGGMAGLFADAYGDLFKNNAKTFAEPMEDYRNRAITFAIIGSVLTIAGIGLSSREIMVERKKNQETE